jgi:hypothetical protein
MSDIVNRLGHTGFCWRCGRQRGDKLFCNVKCQNQYEREQDRYIIKSKRQEYGVAGNTH